jgi:pyrroloquinoline quinone biosynthesis protein B
VLRKQHLFYFTLCMKYIYSITFFLFLLLPSAKSQQPYIYILGVAQDGGYPHTGCEKQCCTRARNDVSKRRNVVSFALVNPATKQWWLFEATPDINEQLHLFSTHAGKEYKYLPDGIFITHAHIGHYAGLMQLGREVMGTKSIPVYVLPKMKQYLETNGPWSQLVSLHNIVITPLEEDKGFTAAKRISIIPFTVPHRDEYSETAGFKILTSKNKYLFIPDIDKWAKWNKQITDEVKSVDIALIDATFYDGAELPNRNISEVPHPFVSETMQLFNDEPAETKSKIHFIHFNHTNPALWNDTITNNILSKHYNITRQGNTL